MKVDGSATSAKWLLGKKTRRTLKPLRPILSQAFQLVDDTMTFGTMTFSQGQKLATNY